MAVRKTNITDECPIATAYNRRTEDRWMLDKKIPLALLFGIMFQSAAIVWSVSTLYSRVGTLEDKALAAAPIADRVLRLELTFQSMEVSLREIKQLLVEQKGIRK